MGVCCSKDEVVKIKETVASKPEDRGPLIQENIGPGGGNLGKLCVIEILI